jgi:1-hydroxycarotenoid 3,4-desaturase
MLCIVNAPANGDTRRFSSSEIELCEERTFSLLTRCGLVLQRDSRNTVLTTPSEFAAMFPATGGALYGRASHGWRASFQRPGARTRVPGLYLAGGSTHPGPGVPMAALSGRMAAASALSDLASTRRSNQAAMPGGTSTRFPMTDGTG